MLSLQDLPDPLVGPDQVLVAVRAASVNPVDYKIREGLPAGCAAAPLPAGHVRGKVVISVP
ncbi:alcohol dehydrogenase catalytic domain-containing protein [Kutzneria sp. NPDC052558]|uniref:alcohol dehydrogenase catalytic domain-containing protein n=1 Tax=Kutzneria sp. NPDC052558 TaxID=3364121 RepID=UPI0037C690E0